MSSGPVEGFPTPAGLKLPPAEALMSLLSRVEPVAGPWSRFAKALMSDGRLDPCLRELVVLRMAHRRGCDYVLAGHLVIAAHCGLSNERIAVATGRRPLREARGADRAVITATDELADRGRISPEIRAELLEWLGGDCLVELVMLAGQYALVGMICRTFDLMPEPAGVAKGYRRPSSGHRELERDGAQITSSQPPADHIPWATPPG